MNKYCKGCNTTKPTTEFTKDKNRKDNLTFYCKSCCSEQRKKYYDKSHYASTRRHSKMVSFVSEYKRQHGCYYCGEDMPIKLCFHHKDENTKSFPLSTSSIMSKTIEMIMDEINKCVVLCHNCHMLEHHGEK